MYVDYVMGKREERSGGGGGGGGGEKGWGAALTSDTIYSYTKRQSSWHAARVVTVDQGALF